MWLSHAGLPELSTASLIVRVDSFQPRELAPYELHQYFPRHEKGLGFRDNGEEKMENEMETGIIEGLQGLIFPK